MNILVLGSQGRGNVVNHSCCNASRLYVLPTRKNCHSSLQKTPAQFNRQRAKRDTKKKSLIYLALVTKPTDTLCGQIPLHNARTSAENYLGVQPQRCSLPLTKSKLRKPCRDPSQPPGFMSPTKGTVAWVKVFPAACVACTAGTTGLVNRVTTNSTA